MRRSDRIEGLVLSFAVLLTVVAIAVAGAIGTFVHDARTLVYAEEALTRHQVTATAIEPGVIVVQPPRGVSLAARAKWSAFGRAHTGVVKWSNRAEIGAQRAIWVNDAGENVGPPSTPSRADGDAVAIAISVWFGVAGASAGLAGISQALAQSLALRPMGPRDQRVSRQRRKDESPMMSPSGHTLPVNTGKG